jgi:hypothetical protein
MPSANHAGEPGTAERQRDARPLRIVHAVANAAVVPTTIR